MASAEKELTMLARQLTSAMEDYLAALEALDRWEFDEEELRMLRSDLAAYRRRLLALLDASEPADVAHSAAASRTRGRPGHHEVPARHMPPRDSSRSGCRVMVAVDDSDPGRWALAVGSNIAAAVGAEVVLVHVINPAVATSAEMPGMVAELRGRLLRRADVMLAAARSAVPDGIQVERVVRQGDAGEEIVAAAREWEADVVVIGTRGRGRLATFLLGSTAETVVRQAHCPVVTVGHDPSGVAFGHAPPALQELAAEAAAQ